MNNPLKLIISLAIPQLVGGLGAIFTASSVRSWYQTLDKPSWNPPDWLFGPAWTILYVLMGIACFLIWKSNSPDKKRLLTFYGLQLFINGIWSPAFFGLQNPLLGLVIIIPLWALILVCVLQFRKASEAASFLMIPYLLWVTFATSLNAAIWWMN
jgi:benzodiazapine receptor